jgi:hypothetical protein
MIHNFQSQVLIGTVLGGSSLVKPPKGLNYYLSMRSKDDKWLIYKMSEMKEFFPEIKCRKYGNTYRCNSSCNPLITSFYYNLYEENKRKIKMSLLDTLTDTGIAIWFLDSGGKTGRNKKNAYINTTKFGKEGTDIIMQYFNEIELFCNINHDGNRLKVLFSVKGTESLFRIIAHRFPKFMYYRI